MRSDSFEYIEVAPGTSRYAEYLGLRQDIFGKEVRRMSGGGRSKLGYLYVDLDRYDRFSRHLLAIHCQTGKLAGCARVILPQGHSRFNVEERYEIEHDPKAWLDHSQLCEISRMGLADSFRWKSRQGAGIDDRVASVSRHAKFDLLVGMYREIFRLSVDEGFTHCFAALEPSYARLLRRNGFPFEEIGPVRAHMGRRARRPYLISRSEMEVFLGNANPYLFSFLSEPPSEMGDLAQQNM